MTSPLPNPSLESRASLEHLSDRVARGSRLVHWMNGTTRLGFGLSLSAAGGLLVARSVFGWDALGPWDAMGVLAAAWAAAGAASWWRSGQNAMSRNDAALWLDLRSDASGRVVTAAEVSEASAAPWRREAEGLAGAVTDVPKVDWSRPLLALGAGALALLVVRLVPVRTASLIQGGGLASVLEERLEEVAEKLDVLEEEVALEDEEQADLEASLERLEEEIQRDPDIEATYEALERLEDELAARAEEALEEAKNALLAMAEAQRSSAGEADTPEAGEALEGTAAATPAEELPTGAPLESALSQLGLADKALSDLPLGDLSALAAGDLSELSKEELAELSSALAEAMAKPLSALEQAGLLSKAQKGAPDGSWEATLSSFKPAGELPELSAEQLAMLGLCPDCGQPPGEDCAATGGT